MQTAATCGADASRSRLSLEVAAVSRLDGAGLLLHLSDPEDLRPTVGAGALNCRLSVLHRYLGRTLNLDPLLTALDAITSDGHLALLLVVGQFPFTPEPT